MKKITLILTLFLLSTTLIADQYSFRKYSHVKKFYSEITLQAIEVANRYKLPPATILAIAGLESGYGSGYVAQITGNILSLGAFKGDFELPPLYLPYSKSKKKILFDPQEIAKADKNDLNYKKRAKSYKRDYRPKEFAGSTKNLEFLKYNENFKKIAYTQCLNDFATRWIVKSSNIKAFRDARAYLDKKVSKNGIRILYTEEINSNFIDKIGGIPHSFNYRESWPKKVKLIMHKVGLIQLTHDIYYHKKSFEEAWGENK